MQQSLEMGISREEFLRLLPAAVGPAFVVGEAGLFRGGDAERRWTLQLRPLASRRLGSVVLPRHQVELHLEGYSDEDAEAFLIRFRRGFQRGGG